MHNNGNTQKDITIRLFRVIACIMVLLTHMRAVVPMNAIAKYIDFGGFGVGVFFIISGYLAFNSAELANGRVLNYYKKRALRILPLFYVVILIWGILRSVVFCDMPEDPVGLYWLNYILLIFKSYPNSVIEWSNVGAVWTIASFIYFYLLMPLFYKYINSFIRALITEIFFIGINIAYYLFSIKWFEPLSDLCIFGLGILIYFAKKESQESKFTLFGCLLLILWIINLSDVKHMLFISIIMAIMIINGNVKNTTIEHIKVLGCLLNILDHYSFDIYLSHPIVLYLVSTLGIAGNNTLLKAIVITIGIIVLSIILDNISSAICSVIEKLLHTFNCMFGHQ